MAATESIAGINVYLTRTSGTGMRADMNDVNPAVSASN
jgi:hypothetical protein